MKKMNEAKHDAIVAVLNNMDIDDLVRVYNEMAEDNYDETIYTNEDYTLNELFPSLPRRSAPPSMVIITTTTITATSTDAGISALSPA